MLVDRPALILATLLGAGAALLALAHRLAHPKESR